MWHSLFLILGFVSCGSVNSQNLAVVKQLYGDLLTNYSRAIIPVPDRKDTLYVDVITYLSSIVDFKDTDETISLMAGFVLSWTDPSLTWMPSEYSNLSVMVVPNVDIWTPPLTLVNSVNKVEIIGSDIRIPTYIYFNGIVVYAPSNLLETKCPTDLSKFPFDTQTCIIKIMPVALPSNYLTLQSRSSDVILDAYVPHSEWGLMESSLSTGNFGLASAYHVTLKLKRASLYYIVMIIIPTFLFAFLNPLVYLLPVESGERIGYALTILLSYAIFLTLVSTSIPTSSNPMCALLITMVTIIIISGLIVVGVVLSSKYYNLKDVDRATRLLRYFAEVNLKKKHNSIKPEDIAPIHINGKDLAEVIDCLFFYGSYIIIALIGITFLGFTNSE